MPCGSYQSRCTLKNEDEVVSQRPCTRLRVGLFSPVHLMTTGSVMGGVAGRAWQLARTCGLTTRFSKHSKGVAYGAIPHSHL